MSDTTSAPTTPEANVPDTTQRTLRLPQATALIVGSIIGVGIFNLPGSLASYGPISIFAMALTTVGALALAYMFAAMSRRLPADGGPYAYARAAFGNPTGFANAWSYWITAWAGNAAIVVGWVFYVQYVIEGWITAHSGDAGWLGATIGGENGLMIWPVIFALVGLWIPAAINLVGVKSMGSVQLWTSIIKFVPLVLMSTIGLFAIIDRELQPDEPQRRQRRDRDPRRHGAVPVLLPRRRDRVGRRGQGPQPRRQRPEVHDLRHARDRGRLPAVADRRVRLDAVRSARRRAQRRTPPPPTP